MTRCSVLTAPLPSTVRLNGGEIPISTDFRVGILFAGILKDQTLLPAARERLALRLYYPHLPDEISHAEAFLAVCRFYSRMQDEKTYAQKNIYSQKKCEPILDFDVDGDRIYAAFYNAYGIDLCTATLHWWQFLALLTALPADCAFMRTVSLRCMDPAQVRDEETRRRLRRAKAGVRIRRTVENREEQR